MKLSSIAGALALATVFALVTPAALAAETQPQADDTQASPEPEAPKAAPGEWASAEATVKTTAPSNCRHSPMHREADGCTPGACTSAKTAVRAAMRQAIGAACDQYIVVKSTCQYGPNCKK